jgi:hypothetical protein
MTNVIKECEINFSSVKTIYFKDIDVFLQNILWNEKLLVHLRIFKS